MFTGIIAAIGEVRACEAIGAGRDMRLVIGVPGEGVGTPGVMRAGGLLFLPPLTAQAGEVRAGGVQAGEGVADGVGGCVRAIRGMLEAEGEGLGSLVRLGVAVAAPAGPDAIPAALALEGVRAGLAAMLPAGGPVPAITLVARLPDGAAVQVEAVARASQGAGGFLSGAAPGASIACSGCCLTVVAFGADWFAVEASAETLSLTTLGGWRAGTAVNLERALRLGDELGGHMVSGHVDGLGEMVARRPENGSLRMKFAVPPALARFVATKGSIAVDGVSLTVNSVRDLAGDDGDGGGRRHASNGAVFGVNVIPHTAQATTLGLRRPGEAVHIEVDGVARNAARLADTGRTDRRWADPQAWGAADEGPAPDAPSGTGTDEAGAARGGPGGPARTGA